MVNQLYAIGQSREVTEQALRTHRAKNNEYRRYIDYYEGRHNLNFATLKWRNAFAGLFRQFADNLCAPIIDAAADRLKVTGFATSDDASATVLWNHWTRSKMDRKAGTVHEHVLKAGDAYVIVWPNPITQDPEISPNPAHQVCCYYDENGAKLWASKLWRLDNDQWRLTLYFPDRIEKYITISRMSDIPDKVTAFRAYTVIGERWPLPNPYGVVPVFHFANKPEMGVWGESELYNIIPIQDALNKSVADMLIAMEYASLPQRWVTGLEIPEDPVTGKPIVPFEAGVDRVWSAEDTDARFGQFDSADFQHFTNVQNDFRLEMARISRTPLHYLSLGGASQGAFVSSVLPSGESLKTAEAPFTAKLEDRQTSYGDVWEEVESFVATLMNMEIPTEDIQTIWLPPSPKSLKDDLEDADVKINKLGIPHEIVWAELGYSTTDIAKMTTIREAEQAKVQQQIQQQPPVRSGNQNGSTQSN